MARIKLSALITDISGSVGGSTFQRSRSGVILRNKPRRCFVTNSYLSDVRTNATTALRNWKSLTETEQYFWRSAVEYYRPTSDKDKNVYLTPYTYYLKYTLRQLQLDGSITQPTTMIPPPVGWAFDYFDNGVAYPIIHITGGLPSGFKWYAEVSQPFTYKRTFDPRYLRWARVTTGSTLLNVPDYVSRFGRNVAAGEFVMLQLSVLGSTSPFFSTIFSGTVEAI
jgi:hypothetical protein